MKNILALIFALGPILALAQTPTIVQGPPYIVRGQVVTIPNSATLTTPTMTAFPVDAFTVSDIGTIDGSGNQSVISTTPWTTTSFDMLDARHVNNPITASFGGQSYTVPEGGIVALFGAAVQAEVAARAKAKAGTSTTITVPAVQPALPYTNAGFPGTKFVRKAPDGVNDIYLDEDGNGVAETLVYVKPQPFTWRFNADTGQIVRGWITPEGKLITISQ